MDTDKPFASYDEVEKHALKLRLQSETALLRFENHTRALGEKQVRANLFKGAVRNVVHDVKPVQAAAELLTSGGIGSQLLMGLLTRRGSFTRRLLTTLAVAVVPNLLGKVPWNVVMDKVGNTLRTAEPHEHNGHSTH